MASPLFLPEFAPGVVCVLDVEEVASPLFLPEFAPCVICAPDGHVEAVEEVAYPLFLPELAPGVVCAPDGHVDTVEEVASTLFLPELAPCVVCAPDGHVDAVEEVTLPSQVEIFIQFLQFLAKMAGSHTMKVESILKQKIFCLSKKCKHVFMLKTRY